METMGDPSHRLQKFMALIQGTEHIFWIVERDGFADGPESIARELGGNVELLESRTFLSTKASRLKVTPPPSR